MARTSKNPSGGAGLLFLTGLGIEVLVGVVAARAVLADAIADSGILSDMRDGGLLPGARVSEPSGASPAPAGATGLDAEVDLALATSAEICSALAEPSDYDTALYVTVTARGGRVSTARVDAATGALAACIEAEALEWRLTPAIQQVEIIRPFRIEPP